MPLREAWGAFVPRLRIDDTHDLLPPQPGGNNDKDILEGLGSIKTQASKYFGRGSYNVRKFNC